MKTRTFLQFFLISSILCGCASGPHPMMANNGHYYMAGDDACERYSINYSTDSISCYTSDGTYTGDRQPMTQNDMQMYAYQQQQQQQSIQQMNQQLQQLNQTIKANTPSIINCYDYGFGTNCIKY